MEWQPEIKELFEGMVSKIPEMVRPVVRPALLEAAEKKCAERNGKMVAEVDLVVALFEVTPPAFQPTMIEDLESFGIPHRRYMAKVDTHFRCNTDLDQMVKDMGKICEFTGVKYDESAIWKALKHYSQFYIGAPVSIRTTSKPVEKRDVSVRYVELMHTHNPDPYTTAINEGLIEKNGHPIHKMIREVQKTFHIMGYGVDIDSRIGLSKIWPFVVPGTIEPIFSMKYIPEGMKKSKEYFNKHGLTAFSLFAFDFLKNTTNIYFMLQRPSKATYENCVALVEDLGFGLASKEVMEGCVDAAHLNYTFSWDSDKIERLCFGITCDHYNDVPVHLHPIMKEFVEKTPLQCEKKKFVWGATFSRDGFYYKIENDYNGYMADFLLTGCKAGIDTYK